MDEEDTIRECQPPWVAQCISYLENHSAKDPSECRQKLFAYHISGRTLPTIYVALGILGANSNIVLAQKKNVHRSHYWAEPLQFWFRVQQRRWTTNWTNEELFNEYEKPMFIFKTKKHNTDSEYKKRDSSVPRISQMPQLKGISGACAILTQHFYSWKYMFERTGMTIHIVYVNVNAHTNTINRSSPTYILINYIQIQTLQYNVVQQIYFICIVN